MVIWNEKVLHRLTHFAMWSLVGGYVLWGSWAFRMWSLAGESMLLFIWGRGWEFIATPYFEFASLVSCLWIKMRSLSFIYWPPVVRLPLTNGTVIQKSPLFKSLLVIIFCYRSRKATKYVYSFQTILYFVFSNIYIHHYIVFNYFSLFTLFYYTLLLELNFCKIILICQNNEISPKITSFLFFFTYVI